MKYRKAVGLAVFSLLLILCVVAFRRYSMVDIKDVLFSHPSGFYDGTFELELSSRRRNQIYYTLDGSEPTTDSLMYVSPILIADATANENVFSLRTDTSTGFYSDLIAAYGSPNDTDPGYVVPTAPVDKCTVIKAASYNKRGKRCSDTISAVYFVGFDEKPAYEHIGVISIAANPDDLFCYESGIYATGKAFDEFAAQEENLEKNMMWWWWDGNYHNHGREWERVAQIDYFDADRQLCISQIAGIRIKGGGSRGKAEKSLNLYARPEYSGTGTFSGTVFPSGYSAQKLTLFSGGDDATKLKDYMVHTLASELHFATMDFVPCALFLNGEYWGLYYLTECYDNAYTDFHYGIGNISMVKNDLVEVGSQRGRLRLHAARDYVTDNDMTNEQNYQSACTQFDMDSYIDYFASQIYIGRCGDWPSSNIAYWQSNRVQDAAQMDGRWRLMMFDSNSGALSADLADLDSIRNTAANDAAFASLLDNDAFRKQFCIRLMDLGNTVYREESVDAFIDAYISQFSAPMLANNRRFYGEDVTNTRFTDAVEDVRAFFDGRLSYMLSYINRYFGFQNATTEVTLALSDPDGGSIQINTVRPAFQNGAWSGMYVRAFPITLQAHANAGYRAVGWELNGTALLSGNTLEVPLNGDTVHIRAIFEKE